jgi:dihydropyrimidinase
VSPDLVLAGGQVVTPAGVRDTDVLIEDGRVAALRRGGSRGAARISASGCLIFPGGVDSHAHLLGDLERATISALHGGTTTAFTFPLPRPGESAVAAFRRARRAVARDAAIGVGIHASYLDPGRVSPRELATLAGLGAFGVQAFLAFPELGLMFSDGELHRLLREAPRHGLVPQVQCESGSLVEALTRELLAAGERGVAAFPRSRPPEVEEQAVRRTLGIARLAGADVYLVHLSTRGSLALVGAARAAGQRVTVELCTHHLLLDERAYSRPDGARFIVGPPLRARADVAALWRAIRSGAASLIGSDHHTQPAPPVPPGADFTELPMGLRGIELRVPLVLSEGLRRGIAPPRLADLLATRAAATFGLAPRRGAIAVGADADLVVWDPRPSWTVSPDLLHDGWDDTPYAGLRLRGRIRYVIAGGRVAVADGELAEAPRGGLLAAAAARGAHSRG